MNYGLAEKEIVDRLNQQFALNNVQHLYEAVLLPETEQEAQNFKNNFTKARVAVGLSEVMPLPSNGNSKVTQEEIVRFRLSYEARRLRGPGGLYALQLLTKIILVGYRLSSAINRLTLSKYGLLDFEQNGIMPYYEFECKAVNEQAFNDNPDDVPFGTEPIQVIFPPEALAG